MVWQSASTSMVVSDPLGGLGPLLGKWWRFHNVRRGEGVSVTGRERGTPSSELWSHSLLLFLFRLPIMSWVVVVSAGSHRDCLSQACGQWTNRSQQIVDRNPWTHEPKSALSLQVFALVSEHWLHLYPPPPSFPPSLLSSSSSLSLFLSFSLFCPW